MGEAVRNRYRATPLNIGLTAAESGTKGTDSDGYHSIADGVSRRCTPSDEAGANEFVQFNG